MRAHIDLDLNFTRSSNQLCFWELRHDLDELFHSRGPQPLPVFVAKLERLELVPREFRWVNELGIGVVGFESEAREPGVLPLRRGGGTTVEKLAAVSSATSIGNKCCTTDGTSAMTSERCRSSYVECCWQKGY